MDIILKFSQTNFFLDENWLFLHRSGIMFLSLFSMWFAEKFSLNLVEKKC